MTSKKRNFIFDGPTTSESLNKKQKPNETDGRKKLLAAGLIESIELKNFMCHDSLKLELKNKLNFITGRNGSGKSALLAAVVVGLGGKASIMNRGNSLREYVKSGSNSAQLIITLSNEGSDAFDEKNYQSKIIIERKINAAGSGGYKIKSSSGQIVSERRDELNRILDHFNIQLENPMTILTQDLSRQFLQSMKPNKLYEFFMRSTQLEQMRNDLNVAAENTRQAIQIFESRSTHLPKVKKEVDALNEQINRHKSLDSTRSLLEKARLELPWAAVFGQESVIAEFQQKIDEMKTVMARTDLEIVERKKRVNSVEQCIDDTAAELQNFDSCYQQTRFDYERSKQHVSCAKTELINQQTELKNIEDKLSATVKEKENLQQYRNTLNSGINDERIAQNQKRRQDFEELRLRCIEDRAKKANLDKHLVELRTSVDRNKETTKEKDAELRASNYKIEKIRQQLESLRGSQQNRSAKFGAFTPRLLQMIDLAWRNKPAGQKPQGPIGSLITVTDQRWALAVENCLGGLSYAYVCDNFKDCEELERIMRDCPGLQHRPQIIVSKFINKRFDVSKNTPECPFPTVLSVLDIKEPIIFNTLVDQRGIESVILIEDEVEMRDRMYKQNLARESFSLNGAVCQKYPVFRYYPSTKNQATILAASVDNVIKAHEAELWNLSSLNKELMQEYNEASNKTARSTQELQNLTMEIRRIDEAININQRKLRESEEKLADVSLPNPGDDVLEAEISNLDNAIKTLEEQLRAVTEKLKAKKEESDDASKQLNEIQQKYQDMRGGNERLNAKLADWKDEKRHLEQQLSQASTLKASQKAKIEKFLNDLKSAENYLKELKDAAEKESGPRKAEVYRKVEIIENEIAKLEQKLRIGERELGDINELIAAYNEKKEKLQKMQEEHEELQQLRKLLEEAQKCRKSTLKDILSRTCIAMKQNFILNLRLREYSGKLIIDHREKKIDVEVYTDNKSCQKDLKGLSGGERSFVTVSFLLSMWELMETPFRFLDEFDVFMDAENRKFTTKMLISVSQKPLFGQLTLLTPVDLDLLPEDRSLVKIHRLLSPRELEEIDIDE